MKSSGDFLLEIGCEEIPAGVIPLASRELQQTLEKQFEVHSLASGGGGPCVVETAGGPRRLTALCRNLPARQKDLVREVLGAPKAIAFDSSGRPTRAAESFAEKQGIGVEQIQVVHTAKGEYIAARHAIPGRSSAEVLREILPQAILQLPFPRAMYWTGASGPRFVRPIRWVVALLDGRVIPFEVAGVRAGSDSQGHRFLGRQRVPVSGGGDYFSKLKKNFVMVRPAERRKRIEEQIRSLAGRNKWKVHEDKVLLELVTNLNEYPTVIQGSFDPAYLELPEEILITVMRDHQKYFAVENRQGELEPHFLAVINLDKDAQGTVRAGHERVLRARFADARFFWDQDQKCPLQQYLPKLAQVTFASRLGNYRDKVERMRSLARWIAGQWFNAGIHQADVPGADRAAELAKCDLVTEMVREFTELQGIVGGLYARAQGEPEEIAAAVYEHYRPAGPDDVLPRSLTGCAVSMADKLDSLVACFAIGAIPSGSSDPFALRRAALGIVRILLERKLPLSLSAAIASAAKALEQNPPHVHVPPDAERNVLDFILDRARYILRERQGYAYDEVNAAFSAGADDLVDVLQRTGAIKAIRKTKNFLPLAISFKRIRNILEKAGQGNSRLARVDMALFEKDAERELHQSARKIAERAGQHKRTGSYKEALEVIAGLRPAVDRFFDEVLVMAEEDVVRQNRLALLSELLHEFSTIADFSEIVTADPKQP